MPESEFITYKLDIKNAYPDEAVTCEDESWCYFFKSCSEIIDQIPDIEFQFRSNTNETFSYKVPPLSFLFSDVDYRTNLTTCHLGIVGQKYSTSDYWVLGGAFMENFYVTYDGEQTDSLRVGLSYNFAEAAKEASSGSGAGHAIILTIAIVTSVFIVALIATIVCCIRARKNKEQRLTKAKTFFDSMKNEAYDPEQQFMETQEEEEEEEQQLKESDPNAFINASLAQDDEEEVSENEMRDKVPDNLSPNEQAVGELI